MRIILAALLCIPSLAAADAREEAKFAKPPVPAVQPLPQNCAPRTVIVAGLAGKYVEDARGVGMTGQGTVLELWHARGGETWTIIISRPDGIACAVTAGTGWQAFPARPQAPNS